MGREVRRMPHGFEWPLGRTWKGYLLDPIPCFCCEGTGKVGAAYCTMCEGKGKVRPRVEPPGYQPGMAPDYIDAGWMANRYGWQMWETTSEGSPISPVCESPEALARWLADNNASAFGYTGASYEAWLHMIRGPGWAPSAVSVGGPLVSGVEGLAGLQEEET